MRKIVLSTFLVLLVFHGISQQSFRLHVQPGKPQLAGDGDDYTTLAITARDKEGEVITTMNGKVAVRVSAGFCEAIEVNMQDGVALVKYTSPMFGTPIKASQRMVYFLFKFMTKFIARSAGSTDVAANQKLATDITIESFKEGLFPVTLIPKKDGDNFAYIVCEMNGVKGKAKIEILKATEGLNGSIVPGVYYGRDITGQSDWKLNIYSSGTGTWGEANSSEDNYNTIMFSNEVFTEMNDFLGKTAGMTGFLKAYLGPSWKETQYIKDYDIVKMGMGSAYMPMPNNGVFIYVPPILFEYQGRPTSVSPGSSQSGKPEEVLKTDKSGIILSQNEIIGDGKSRTRAVFHYQDENGVPVSGKAISWSIPVGIKQISIQTVTDANGNAETVLEAPVLKATGETRGENTGQIIDNYDLFKITVNYSSPKRANDYTEAYLSVYKTIERNVRILKPGFEEKSFKLLLPQLEHFKLESSVYTLIEMINSPSVAEKTGVNDAVVFIERKKFDEEKFNRYYETYFKKDRKLFLSMLDDEKGGFFAITNGEGKFSLNVGINPDKKLPMEPMPAKLSDLTGRRKGELGKTLKLFDDPEFVNKVIDGLFRMDKDLCGLKAEKAVMTEEKLHLIGMLMVNANTGDKLIKDTGDELMGHGWELMKTLAEYANGKWNITDKMYKKLKLDKVSDKLDQYGKQIKKSTGLDKIDGIADSLTKIGLHYENAFWKTALAKDDYKYGTKKIIQYFLAETVLPEGAKNADKAKASAVYYKLMGDYGGELAGKVWENLSESISEALAGYVVPTRVKDNYDKASKYVEETQKTATDYVPDKIKEAIQAAYYSSMKEHILQFFAQSPENVHLVYTDLQPALRDRSTELRTYYAGVAAWRYSAEMLKAYIDLGIDLVVKSIIIIVDGYSGNWTSIAGHMKKLDEGKSAIGTAFTAGGFSLEMYRLNNLWAEVLSSFVYANKCIEQGSTKAITVSKNHWSVFPSAYAAVPGKIASVNLTVPGMEELKYTGNSLPVKGLNAVFNNSTQIESWLEENMFVINRLAFTRPDEAAALFENVSQYRSYSEQLAILSIAVAADPRNAGLAKEFNKTASDAAEMGKLLKESIGVATLAMNELPSAPQVGGPGNEKPVFQSLDSEMLVYGGAGLGGLLVVLLTIVIIRRRRRKSHATPAKETTPPTPPYSLSPPVALSPPRPSPQPSHPISDIPLSTSPKFCPQCGSAFKPEAKFCGKCGFKPK